MNELEIKDLVQRQCRFFNTGKTLNVDYRVQTLKRLKACILKHEKKINTALRMDLGKSAFESYMCETGMVLSELSYMLRHVQKFASEKSVRMPLAQFPSRGCKKPVPYGLVLIMSPWNYPFMLTMEPLIDALAAGNTVVLKPSAYAPHTSALLVKMIKECFEKEYVAVVSGGRAENACLLEEHFDYIFFTGSQRVGKEVMRKASEHLTPISLELGGKSPCIVERTADVRLAARRIVFGKLLNCGQTCVAPDYIYCDRRVKEKLIRELKRQLRKQYGRRSLHSEEYGRIINAKHFERLQELLDKDREKIICGGASDRNSLFIEPTLLDNITFSDAVMQEEIFGPLLPIVVYDSLDEAIRNIQAMAHPLALYIFTKDKRAARRVIANCGFGGGCINDTLIHLATNTLPLGGFGESGMGSYHGKAGFDTFTHYKSIVDKKTYLDLPMRYHPYRKYYNRILRLFLQ